MAPPLSVINIVKYCGVGGGALIRGRKNPTQIMAPPLPVIKIVKYCDVWAGGIGGAKILQKIMASPLSVIKIVKYCGVRGRGGGGITGRQNFTKDYGVPSLSVIKIVKYCGIRGGGGALRGAKILQKIKAPLGLSVIKIVGKIYYL